VVEKPWSTGDVSHIPLGTERVKTVALSSNHHKLPVPALSTNRNSHGPEHLVLGPSTDGWAAEGATVKIPRSSCPYRREAHRR